MARVHLTNAAFRLIAFLTVSVYLLTGMTGCLPGNEESTEISSTQPAAPETSESVEQDEQDRTDAPLRLWWPRRETLNPLTDQSMAGQAVYNLVYRGLFRIQSDDRLEADLAENLTFMHDGKTVVIVLKKDQFFHDGTPVTAQDAAAVLEWLIDPDNESLWSLTLKDIESISALGDRVVQLTLTNENPWIGYALTFPLIPEQSLSSEPMTLIPGTGQYQISRYDPDAGLVLKSTDNQNGTPELIVKEFLNQAAAARAFEKDELDLVLLDTKQISGYTVRSSLRLDSCPGSELLLLSYQNQESSVLSNAQRLCYVKHQMQLFKEQSESLDAWAVPSSIGVALDSVLADQNSNQMDDYFQRCSVETWTEETPLVLIAPEQDERRVFLIKQIAAWLEAANIPCSVYMLDDDTFWETVASKQYDLALWSIMLPNEPAPGFMVRNPLPEWSASLALIDTNPAALDDAIFWKDRLNGLKPFDSRRYQEIVKINTDWSAALVQAVARSPWEIICIPYMAVAYGDRVRGHLSPSRYHPYNHIEELWKWSGSSLSS